MRREFTEMSAELFWNGAQFPFDLSMRKCLIMSGLVVLFIPSCPSRGHLSPDVQKPEPSSVQLISRDLPLQFIYTNIVHSNGSNGSTERHVHLPNRRTIDAVALSGVDLLKVLSHTQTFNPPAFIMSHLPTQQTPMTRSDTVSLITPQS